MNDTDFPLSQPEKELILYWRSLNNAEVMITYQDGTPVHIKCFYPGFINIKETSNRPVDSLEQEVIGTGRLLAWGNLSVHVENGSPLIVLNDSYQMIKLSTV